MRRRLWPDVNPSLFSAWMKECAKSHPYECANLPSAMRVIDLTSKCIIDAPINCRYVALSYVWGGTQGFSLRSSTSSSWACSPPWDLSSLDTISESLLKCKHPNIPTTFFCTDQNAALHPNPSIHSSTIQPALKREQLAKNRQ